MGNYDQVIDKEGETLEHYVHSFESSRDATTNLKESKWATAVNITAIVRSQPSSSDFTGLGTVQVDVIIILTKTDTVPAKHDVVKWNSEYYDVILVEPIFFRKAVNYYKSTCQRRIEFLGS